MPKILVTTSDKTWIFSSAISLFNLIAFIFVAVAYAIIYKKTNKSVDAGSKTGQKTKRKVRKHVKGNEAHIMNERQSAIELNC